MKGYGLLFLGFIFRKLRFLSSINSIYNNAKAAYDSEPHTMEIKMHLHKNLNHLKEILSGSCDLKIHLFQFGPEDRLLGALVFIDGLADNLILTEAILRPATEWQPEWKTPPAGQELVSEIAQKVLCAGDVKTVSSLSELASGCLAGDTALLVNGCITALVVNTRGWDKRSISEPQSETVIRGPREGFTENLRTNTALIRRKIKSGQLCVDHMTVGRKTRTDICLMYLSGVADPKVVETVKYRISRLDVDSILESGYIEEYIEDAPFSLFATVGYSEKPDVIAARILEGRVAVVVDGTPFVLTAPMLFIESFQTTEDYYTRPLYASLIRILRFMAYFITAFAPALYIALTSFHQELIPTTLLFTIANAREGTPFPVFIEMAIMVFSFEILREAGIRLPRPVGQAISSVGALVMGDAAVAAGLVGAPVVITIAITAVAGFLVPPQNDSASILRVLMMILAAFTGWYGISMGFLAVLLHLGSLSSFGVPYFDGFAWTSNLQDSVVRMPLWSMVRRPQDIAHNDIIRRRFFIPPLRPYAPKDENDPEDGGLS
ncbi:MAG: spore germination protein [Clostridiaceae bacterium]|nr:spore germination protein [Clostridiaceae bacterium]